MLNPRCTTTMTTQLIFFMSLFLQCTNQDDTHSNSYLHSSLYYTGENTITENLPNTENQDTYEFYNNPLYYNTMECDSHSLPEYPDYFYDIVSEQGFRNTCELDNAVESDSTILYPLSSTISNNAEYAQLQPWSSSPAHCRSAESFASSALPEHQNPNTSDSKTIQPISPASNASAVVFNGPDSKIHAVEMPDLNDIEELLYEIDTGTSSTVRDDKKHRLIDLERVSNIQCTGLSESLLTVAIASNNVTKYYEMMTEVIYMKLLRLLERSMIWKRMKLRYACDPDDRTKTTVSQLFLTFAMPDGSEPDKAFRLIDRHGQELWATLYRRIFRLHAEMIALITALAQDPPVMFVKRDTAANKIASYFELLKAGNDAAIKNEYRKVLMEMPCLAASLKEPYACIAARICLICEHAAFFDDIITNASDLAKDLTSMQNALEDACQQIINEAEGNNAIWCLKENAMAKEIYGSKTTLEWIKNRCEQILKLCYDLRQYDPIGTEISFKSRFYKALKSLEVPYSSPSVSFALKGINGQHSILFNCRTDAAH